MTKKESPKKEQMVLTPGFLATASPERLLMRYDPAQGKIALLLIDLEKDYCLPGRDRWGTPETLAVARKAGRLADAFRKVGVPIYAVHMWNGGAAPAFTGFRPAPGDKLVDKRSNSAFRSSDINDILKQDGRKLLLVGGVFTSLCVKDTVIDALDYGYKVCLLDDLIANGKIVACNPQADMREMVERGAVRVSVDAFLSVLEAKKSRASVLRPSSSRRLRCALLIEMK